MILLALSGAVEKTSTRVTLPAVARAAEERIHQGGYLALRDIRCQCSDDELSLHGSLPSYYLKQVAQEIAAGVAGARRVVNQIEVLVPAECKRRDNIALPETRFAGQKPQDSNEGCVGLHNRRTKGVRNDAGA